MLKCACANNTWSTDNGVDECLAQCVNQTRWIDSRFSKDRKMRVDKYTWGDRGEGGPEFELHGGRESASLKQCTILGSCP